MKIREVCDQDHSDLNMEHLVNFLQHCSPETLEGCLFVLSVSSFNCISMFVVGTGTPDVAHTWWSEDNFVKPVFFFHLYLG